MASPDQVRTYLACWFQLGKEVTYQSPQTTLTLSPRPMLTASGFSQQFETTWNWILAHAQQCYLDDSQETIADLLSDQWDLIQCATCALPIPVKTLGISSHSPCPCSTIAMQWPNPETLPPRLQEEPELGNRLDQIRTSLMNTTP